MRLVSGVLEPAQTPAICTATGTLRAAAAALRSTLSMGWVAWRRKGAEPAAQSANCAAAIPSSERAPPRRLTNCAPASAMIDAPTTHPWARGHGCEQSRAGHAVRVCGPPGGDCVARTDAMHLERIHHSLHVEGSHHASSATPRVDVELSPTPPAHCSWTLRTRRRHSARGKSR